jgi:ATP-binding protein involved in chromosome partitioning
MRPVAPTDEQVRFALRAVADPELRHNIVELGMVRAVQAEPDGGVRVTIGLTAPGSPVRAHFERAVSQVVSALEGVERVRVDFDVLTPEEKRAREQRARRSELGEGALSGVRNVICVGSGKGGVGKSTLTANLAAALFAEGKRAAALDADVWGYSIPRMLGVHGKPMVSPKRKILPLTAHGGIGVMSIEFFLEQADQAIVWRGPMLHKAIRQFLEDVDWGELDYLLIDLPPGTGDVTMTLAQLLPQSRFLIVTTPQPAAQKVARRAAEAAGRFELELLGVVENMAGFVTPTGERFAIFGEGGGRQLADELDVPLLGNVPLQAELRSGADNGLPLVLTDPDAPAAQAIFHTARRIIAASPVDLGLEPPPVGPSGGASTKLPTAPPKPKAVPALGTPLPLFRG